MADQREITLYPGDAAPNDIVLRDLPVATASAGTTVYLLAGDATANDVILRDPTQQPAAAGTQNYTLEGLHGSYAYSGQGAAVTFARAVAGSAGSYTYAGQSAEFTLARHLAGNAGTYAYTGQDAELTYTPGATQPSQPAWGYGYAFFYPDHAHKAKEAKRKKYEDEDERDRKAAEEAARVVIERVAKERAAFVAPPRVDLLRQRLEAENLAYRKAYAEILRIQHARQHAELMARLERDREDEESILMLF